METSTNSCGQTPSSSDPTASSSRIRRRRHLFSRTDALEMQNISSPRSQTDLRVMPTGRPVPRGTPINVDEDEVLRVVLYHESFAFSRFGQEVKDMPKLGDLTNYDISEEKEKELWKYEVRRLVDIVNHPDRALSYHGTETLGGDTRDAYETLTSLSNRFLSCMNIIILDDELILREHMSKLHNGERFQKSRQMLKRLIDEESTQADLQKGTPEDYFNFVDYNTALLARLFCASAHGGAWHNGCLAVLANWSAKLKVLSRNLIEFAERSVDAARSIPSMCEPMPQIRSSDQLDKAEPAGRNTQAKLDVAMEELLSLARSDEDEVLSSTDIIKYGYWAHQAKFRHGMQPVVLYLVASLRGRNEITPTAPIAITSYELCSEVYESGFGGFPTLLFQDRDGELMGSSHHKCLNVAHAAFDLLLQTITKVQSDQTNRQPPFSRSSTVSRPSSSNTPSANITAATRAHTVPSSTLAPNYSCGTASLATTASNPTPAPGRAGNTPPNSVTPDPSNESSSATAQLQKGHASLGSSATAAQSLPDPIGTRVSWTYGTDKCAFNFRNMGEIIAVMAPLQLTSPVVALMISDIVNMIILSLVKSDPSASVVQYCESKFKASFCMSTAEYQGPSPGTIDYSASSLSQGLMTRDKLLAAERTTQIQGTQLPMVAEDSQRRRRKEEGMIQARKEEIENANRIMKQWGFYEKGVMVSCGRYVWTVIIICTILVIGGIVIGLTVHDRVKAVDPFNITTYLWVLAAFIILVAKSVRVENWPWRDFLLRRVFCRSVTELHAVSGIDPQLILAKLLNDEKSTMLQTRGPHNSPFKRKSEDGFSIDEPLSMWTMLMSGLIMVKVATPQGEALVCLDVRMGTNIAMIRELNLPTDKKEYLCCNKSIPQDVVKGTQQRLPVTQTQLQWYRIIGLFNCRNCVFV